MTWFGDTHYYLALANANDLAHERAREFSRRAGAKIITTAWVVVELADALCAPSARSAFVGLHDAMRADPLPEYRARGQCARCLRGS